MLMVLYFGIFFGTEGHNVGDDPHGWAGGVDIGVSGQVFFKDVILDGA